MKKFVKALWLLPRNILCFFIVIYQKTISPDHSFFKFLFPNGYCKFCPSCSTYSCHTIKKHGVIKGVPLSIWRVLRCNPWSDGGEDPIK